MRTSLDRILRARLGAVLACGVIAISSLAFTLFTLSLEAVASMHLNADALLAADLVHRVFGLHRPWSDFQLPRTPSLVPDFLIYIPTQLALSWPAAIVMFAWLMLVVLVVSGALIAHRITRRPFWLCAAAMLAVTLLPLAAEALFGLGELRLHTFLVVSHGGAFIMSLPLIVLCEWAEDWPKARYVAYGAVAVLTCMVVASDQIALGEVSIPAATAALFWSKSRSHKSWIIAAIVFGTAASFAVDAVLVREIGATLRPIEVPGRIWTMLTTTPLWLMVDLWLPALLFVIVPPLVLPLKDDSVRTAKYYYLAGAAAMFWMAGLTYIVLYFDNSHFRYLYTFLWWPAIGLATVLVYLLDTGRAARTATAGVMAILVVVSADALLRWDAAPLREWRHPLQACVEEAKRRFGLHQGLADYWVARPLTISSGWRLQVDQIFGDGAIRLWGSDLKAFSYRLDQPDQTPIYDFAVMEGLDTRLFTRRYGNPDTLVPCNSTSIAIYRNPIKPKPPTGF